MKPQFLIAAPHSGAGKTTITLGILRAMRNAGLQVQPFKCGPDYLDPQLHAVAAGRNSYNLDRFMMDDDHLTGLYQRYGSDADVLVTEGVMGLFDGAVKMNGSSADLACLLGIPVILVINAKAMAYSAAALLLGFRSLCPELKLSGVIFNFVERESHYQILKEAAEDMGITSLGFLPENPGLSIPSRHLGLMTGPEIDPEGLMEKAAAHIEKHLDLKTLLRLTAMPLEKDIPSAPAVSLRTKKISIARDEAFHFIYPQHLQVLSSLGELSFFSPLHDALLPEADLIYLPGGYPELHLEALAANKPLMKQLFHFHAQGGKIIAECGGMMYLGESITDQQGKVFPMTGILKITTGMIQKKLSLGYRTIQIAGKTFLGHEFHYSQFLDPPPLNSEAHIKNAKGQELRLPFFYTKQLIASYFHLYLGNQVSVLRDFLA